MDEEQVEVDGVVLDADAVAGVGVEGGDLRGQVDEDLLLVDSYVGRIYRAPMHGLMTPPWSSLAPPP